MTTFELPHTKDKALQLKKLFNKPFLADKNAEKKLANIFADDFIFDEINDLRIENGRRFDLRNFLKGYVDAIIFDLDNCPEDFLIEFEDEAVQVLKSINFNVSKWFWLIDYKFQLIKFGAINTVVDNKTKG